MANTLEQMWLEIERLRRELEDLKTQERGALLTDYSSTSTVTGWSAYDSGYPDIFLSYLDQLVYVWFRIEGTSNNTATSFTLPYTCNSGVAIINVCRIMDNGTWGTGIFVLAAGASTVNLYSTTAAAAWTGSGSKRIQGQFIYHI